MAYSKEYVRRKYLALIKTEFKNSVKNGYINPVQQSVHRGYILGLYDLYVSNGGKLSLSTIKQVALKNYKKKH